MPKKLIHYNPMHAGALHCDVPSCGHNLEPRPFTAELIGTDSPDDPKNITVAVKCHDGNLEVERHQ